MELRVIRTISVELCEIRRVLMKFDENRPLYIQFKHTRIQTEFLLQVQITIQRLLLKSVIIRITVQQQPPHARQHQAVCRLRVV